MVLNDIEMGGKWSDSFPIGLNFEKFIDEGAKMDTQIEGNSSIKLK